MSAKTTIRAGALALALAVGPAAAGCAEAQGGLAARVRAAGDGEVRMSFASRPGTCGHEQGISTSSDGRRGRVRTEGGRNGWDSECIEGPLRVALRMQGGRLTDVDTRVGRPFRERGGRVTDLGRVGAPEAARYLLTLAAGSDTDAGDEAIVPAVLADSVEVWPELLRMARDERVRQDTRKSAVFWLSQAAGTAATRGLQELADDGGVDREVRKQAVFALSQRPQDEAVPSLIRLARTHRDPEIRRTALFWLGQSEDPRALELFEELLTRQ